MHLNRICECDAPPPQIVSLIKSEWIVNLEVLVLSPRQSIIFLQKILSPLYFLYQIRPIPKYVTKNCC
jgi:hypothetical protein